MQDFLRFANYLTTQDHRQTFKKLYIGVKRRNRPLVSNDLSENYRWIPMAFSRSNVNLLYTDFTNCRIYFVLSREKLIHPSYLEKTTARYGKIGYYKTAQVESALKKRRFTAAHDRNESSSNAPAARLLPSKIHTFPNNFE
jgi:hypothetical protein